MSTGTLLFNPAAAPTEELESVIVGRSQLVSSLISAVGQQHDSSSTRQHILLIGPRGSGKTHLTELISRRLGDASQPWRTVRLPEETYSYSGLAELLGAISDRDIGVERAWDADVPTVDESLATLARRRQETGKPLLVVLENLPRVLSRSLRGEDEVARLRSILMGEPEFLLIATATSYFEDILKEERPLYDFFRILTLQDLSSDEVEELVVKRAEWDGVPNIVASLPRLRKRTRAIHHLSGGNPRLCLALYEVLANGVSQDIHKQFLTLLDRVTPYYQSRIEDLSPQQARVLTKLASAPVALPAARLAASLGLSTSHTTAVLDVLLAERFVRRTGGAKRSQRKYWVSDRLFRIWLEMRESRGARRRLRFLIDFFRKAYSAKELRGEFFEKCVSLGTLLENHLSNDCHSHALAIDYLGEALHFSENEKARELLKGLMENRRPSDFEEHLQSAAELLKTTQPGVAAYILRHLGHKMLDYEQYDEVHGYWEEASQMKPGVITNRDRARLSIALGEYANAQILLQESMHDDPVFNIWTTTLKMLASKSTDTRQLEAALAQEHCSACAALRVNSILSILPVEGSPELGAVTQLFAAEFADNAEVVDTLSQRAIRAKDYETALRYARQLVESHPNDETYQSRVACALANKGETSEFLTMVPPLLSSDNFQLRSHMLQDVGVALRHFPEPEKLADTVINALKKDDWEPNEVLSLYWGLWPTHHDVQRSLEWYRTTIGLFEKATGMSVEPWSTFRSLVGEGFSDEAVSALHPEIREAIELILRAIDPSDTKVIPSG